MLLLLYLGRGISSSILHLCLANSNTREQEVAVHKPTNRQTEVDAAFTLSLNLSPQLPKLGGVISIHYGHVHAH